MIFFFRTILLLLILCNTISAQGVSSLSVANREVSTIDLDCNDQTFLKYYGRPLNTDNPHDIVATASNGSIIVGHAGNNNANTNGLVISLDSKGNVLWKKQWGLNPDGDILEKVIRLKDGNFLATGFTTPATFNIFMRLWLVKFDSSGSIIYSKYIAVPGGYGIRARGICETSDGGFAITGSTQTTPNASESILMRLNSNSDVLWIVSSKNPFVNSGKSFSSVIEHQGNLIVLGSITNPGGDRDGLLIKFNATGALLWQKRYKIDNLPTEFDALYESNGIYFVHGSRSVTPPYSDYKPCFLQINPDGSVKKALRMEPMNFPDHGANAALPLADGGFITSHSVANGSKDISLTKVSASGIIVWKKRYTQSNFQQIVQLRQAADNGIIGVGNVNYPPSCCTPEVLVIKTNELGEVGQCSSTDYDISFVDPNIISWDADIVFNNVSLVSLPGAFNISDTELPTYVICEPDTAVCEIVEVVGPEKVCNLLDTIQFFARRSAGCLTAVKWQNNDDFFSIVASTDSTVRVLFKKTGKTIIQARPDNNCTANNFVSDSVEITESPGNVDLGADRKICPANEITIDAGNGFKNYQWSDGTTDSSLMVKDPGIYSILATDFCDVIFTDEIEIIASDESFNLGPDRILCDNDTLILRLPQGHTVKSWSPNYNSILIGNNAVVVAPVIDTSYIISSLIYPGCLKSDTVRISVLKHLSLSLGNDTSICAGQSVVFSAPGFADYIWSDNTTGPSIAASIKNNYWLHATAPNGCLSKDTISINNIYAIPVVSLGKQLLVCENSELKIDAGNQFAKYLWQDGTSQSNIIINMPGKYWVVVTDVNGCLGTDTANVTGYLSAPKDFLNKNITLEMCIKGKPVELSALGNWNTYNWSTGSTNKLAKADSPGVYWLEVTNAENCRSKDSVTILQKANCLTGLYFPNAFTPNADGINDLFRPVYFEMPESYLLVIYDRFGGKVFESKDPNKGWTGQRNGYSPGNNSFVWYCQYKFSGAEAQVAKGTVTVVK